MKTPSIFIVTDLGYGDSGKGTIVDALVREHNASLIVRYNGGAQAAHNVQDKEKQHTFHQFGSTFVPGVQTFLSKYMLVNPTALILEDELLRKIGITDSFERLYVDNSAIITTPYHIYANRIREYSRGNWKHGSCGMGIGETVEDNIWHPEQSLFIRDLFDKDILAEKLKWFRQHKQKQLNHIIDNVAPPSGVTEDTIALLSSDEELEATIEIYTEISKLFHAVDGDFLADKLRTETVVFEGAQGILLDEDWGFYPYTTWSKTTPKNALKLCEDAGCSDKTQVIGVMRGYATRHGAGPFVTEDSSLSFSDEKNKFNIWQENFRTGWFDILATRYAIEVAGRIDCLAITCLDQIEQLSGIKICHRYKCSNNYVNQYFGIINGEAYNIKVRDSVDLRRQEKLGDILTEDCEPIYRTRRVSANGLLKIIEEEFKIPIAITSWGAQASDKIFEAINKIQFPGIIQIKE